MVSSILGSRSIPSLAERRASASLREALADLPRPWMVLANRRNAADGPPWVRYIALHRDKGIALVDLEPVEAAVLPLENFFARTGFSASQTGALPIVPVSVDAGTLDALDRRLDCAFAGVRRGVATPDWCEAAIELLLAAPDLMLSQLKCGARLARSESSMPSIECPRVITPSAAALPPRARDDDRDEPRFVLRADDLYTQRQATPQHRQDTRRSFTLYGDEPSFGRGNQSVTPLHTEARSRRGRRRDDRGRAQPRHRSVAVPIAIGVLLFSIAAITLWWNEGPAPIRQAAAPSAASTAAPSLPPSATASSVASPQAANASSPEFPAAIRQVAPPAPLPMPVQKLSPPAVMTAAAPKPTRVAVSPPQVTKAVGSKPATLVAPAPLPKPASAAPSATDISALPPAIAAVLYPKHTTLAPSSVLAARPVSPAAALSPNTVTIDGVTYVRGEQPHSLGTIAQPTVITTTTSPPVSSSAAVPSIAQPAVASAIAVKAPLSQSASGPPREIVISRAPSDKSQLSTGLATGGPPTAINVTPLSGGIDGATGASGTSSSNP